MAAAEIEEADFEAMEKYIRRSQNTVAKFIVMLSIMGMCEETDRTPGARVGMRCWEQADIDLTGARDSLEVVVYTGEDGGGGDWGK